MGFFEWRSRKACQKVTECYNLFTQLFSMRHQTRLQRRCIASSQIHFRLDSARFCRKNVFIWDEEESRRVMRDVETTKRSER